MKYKAVLFDLDDTLLRTYPAKWEQHRATAKRFYGVDLDQETLRAHWGKPTREVVRYLYGTEDTPENMVANYRSLDDEFPKGVHEDTIPVLDRLSTAEVFRGLVTNASRVTTVRDLARVGVAATRFHDIQTVDESGAYKPDPRVFELVLRTLARHGITDNIVYVADDVTDYHATPPGVDFIGITTGVTTREDFARAGVVTVIDRLNELPALLV